MHAGGSAPGGSAPGGGAWSGGLVQGGGCLLRGVSAPGGLSQHALRQTPLPPVDRHTPVKILPWPNFVAAGNDIINDIISRSDCSPRFHTNGNLLKNFKFSTIS